MPKFSPIVFYIPYICLVPKDYNPGHQDHVTSIPSFNSATKKISIKHFRKALKSAEN
jgi:hypothetical protein